MMNQTIIDHQQMAMIICWFEKKNDKDVVFHFISLTNAFSSAFFKFKEKNFKFFFSFINYLDSK